MGIKNSREWIRRVAFCYIPPGMWCSTTILAMYCGQSLPRAASIGLLVAAGGLVVWLPYHLISGQNDGLLFYMFPGLGIHSIRPDSPLIEEFIARAIMIAALALYACIVGCFRRIPREKPAGSSVWDAEIDGLG